MQIVNGINSIIECLNRQGGFVKTQSPHVQHKIKELYVLDDKISDRIKNVIVNAKKYNISVKKLRMSEFSRMLHQARIDDSEGYHQGVLALVEDADPVNFKEIKVADLKGLFIVLDGITDPHNLGAIVRTAAFYGCSGILVPEDKSAKFSATVFKVASGGCEYVPIFTVANLPKTVAILKQLGRKVIGLSEHSNDVFDSETCDLDLDNAVLVVGSEQKGIRPAIKEICDNWLRLDGVNKLSLNASVAFAIATTKLFTKNKK